MKQVICDLNKGNIDLEDVPIPKLNSNEVLIKSKYSLVSLGTEKTLVEFGKGSILQKARSQPEKVKLVLNKMKKDGILPTLEAVFTKLNEPLPLGYSNVGEIIEVGSQVDGFIIGDRVVSNGHHAEYVSVNKNLVSKIPDNVDMKDAAFTVVGSIGLQGIRLLDPKLGDNVAVFGLGLVGQLSAQILKANGCNVLGIDIDDDKCALANKNGIITINPSKGDSILSVVKNYTNANGVDGVLITASSSSSDIISKSAGISRKNGKIILIGVVGLNINRNDFYEKELSFRVSCSYGPGRYDTNYEEKGIDYPYEYVRWTEKRNFEAFLQCLSNSTVDVKNLISSEQELKDCKQFYKVIGTTKSIANIIKYDSDTVDISTSIKNQKYDIKSIKNISNNAAIIGAGNFTKSILLPALQKTDFNLKYIFSRKGLNGRVASKLNNIEVSTTSFENILNDKKIEIIFITTRHDTHSKLIIESLDSGKNVFVEKPLCIVKEDIKNIEKKIIEKQLSLNVGYNRRFSSFSDEIKRLTNDKIPMNIVITVNAGEIDSNHWIQDLDVGGGRILGEVCHFVDLAIHFTGSLVASVCSNTTEIRKTQSNDNLSIIIKTKNHSNVVINYFSNGSNKYSKERIEIYQNNKTLVLDNWRTLRGFGFKGFSRKRKTQDKGHKSQFDRMYHNNTIKQLIPLDQIFNSAYASFAIIESLKKNSWIKVD